MTPTQTDTARELAHRAGDGIEVTLVWYPQTDSVAVRVTDARTGGSFEVDAPRETALDAFEHPYAYVAGDPDDPPLGREPSYSH
ncbi:MAG: hypothetical protein ACXWZP_07360 [Gaiellaceae bacterium]